MQANREWKIFLSILFPFICVPANGDQPSYVWHYITSQRNVNAPKTIVYKRGMIKYTHIAWCIQMPVILIKTNNVWLLFIADVHTYISKSRQIFLKVVGFSIGRMRHYAVNELQVEISKIRERCPLWIWFKQIIFLNFLYRVDRLLHSLFLIRKYIYPIFFTTKKYFFNKLKLLLHRRYRSPC